MKLIVTGATGLVGTEIVRQAVRNPTIISVVAVARRPVLLPDNIGSDADKSKLHSVILEDWAAPYPESTKELLRGADACIWCLAVTPSASKDMDFADVTKICYDYTVNGLANMAPLANKPFRFVYVSGVATERDQSKSLAFLGEYRLMRGRTETALLDYAKDHATDEVQVTVAKPGAIDGPGRAAIVSAAVKAIAAQFGNIPAVHVSEIAAAMIDQCLHGITGEPLWHSDLVDIGQRVLRKEDYFT